MAKSAIAYRDMMLAMLPQGDAWPRDVDGDWAKLFMPFAEEFARVDMTNEQLQAEMRPTQTVALLPEWETNYALPNDCSCNLDQTFTQRRQALVAKYKMSGNQSREFFIGVAKDLGFDISITEYDENNPGPYVSYQGMPIDGEDWNFVWQINVNATNTKRRQCGEPVGEPFSVFDENYHGTIPITRRQCGSQSGEPLTVWGGEFLECVIRDLVHDHRILFFVYI